MNANEIISYIETYYRSAIKRPSMNAITPYILEKLLMHTDKMREFIVTGKEYPYSVGYFNYLHKEFGMCNSITAFCDDDSNRHVNENELFEKFAKVWGDYMNSSYYIKG